MISPYADFEDFLSCPFSICSTYSLTNMKSPLGMIAVSFSEG